MNIIPISSLLGVAAFVLPVSASKETLKVSVSVWPPGSNIYLGESVLLQCTVESNSSFVWRFVWFSVLPQPAPTPNPRDLVSGDSYSIIAVTREDAGSYQCQAKQWESNSTSVVLDSQPVVLTVSELPPPSLTLTPSTRQFLEGDNFSVQCPVSQTNSSGWRLSHFSPGRGVSRVTDRCSPLGGAVSVGKPVTCEFMAISRNSSGLYWCEGAEGRSNAVNITVSYGAMILKTPVLPVFEGDNVVLYCQYRTDNHSNTTFFKDGAEITTSSSSGTVIEMAIENVTQEDEGLYKCASQDRETESPESWLSVSAGRGNSTSPEETADSTSGSWKWVIVSCGLVLLFLIPLTVWLVRHYRYQMFCTRSCWPLSKEDLPAAELPATKQDVTEVQWDLSWMEMSTLLDKQLYPGT